SKVSSLAPALRDAAMDDAAFPVVPVAYFKFTAPIGARDPEKTIAADTKSPVLLLDVDPASDERGKLIPTVAATPEVDDYVPKNVLAVAARPGFVLHPKRTYAFVVQRSLGDKGGARLGVADAIADLVAGKAPPGKEGAAYQKLFAPLVGALPLAHLDPS